MKKNKLTENQKDLLFDLNHRREQIEAVQKELEGLIESNPDFCKRVDRLKLDNLHLLYIQALQGLIIELNGSCSYSINMLKDIYGRSKYKKEINSQSERLLRAWRYAKGWVNL